MKLRYLTAFVGSLMGLVALAACSGGTDDISMGSDGGAGSGGGKPAGGSNTGTAGKDSQSGSTSGGSASSGGDEGGGDESGGNPQGGSATGGSATGGSATGGSATGGTASGGSSSGGMSGGGSSSGGSAGGPTGTCDQDEDCTQCYYPSWPATAKDCYCVACETAPMSEAQCQANAAQYSKLCAGLPMACPVVKCIPPAPAVCSGNQCFTKVVL